MCGKTHGQAQTERVAESHPHGSLNYLYGAFLPGFLANRSDLPGSQSTFGISGSTHLLAKTDPAKEAHG